MASFVVNFDWGAAFFCVLRIVLKDTSHFGNGVLLFGSVDGYGISCSLNLLFQML